MRRIGLTIALIATAAAAALVASAGAANTHTYKVELDNAFGLVNGSEVRIAGVKAGTVTGLDVNAAKKAVITISVSNQFGEFKKDATCSSEPQSLIAEYFLDCQPGSSPQSLVGPVPVAQTTITVPNDLVQNILREPFKQQLALLINEFGTALTGNAENLNAAILRGAPALRSLKTTLDTLGSQNTVIRDLNANSDKIIARLNARREDVLHFIHTANATAAASAQRRTDLALDFKRLPDFLAQLQPTMRELGRVASNGSPLLTDLNRSAGRLTTFSRLLPPFNDATGPALTSLGSAAQVGTQALTQGRGLINQLRLSTTHAYGAADKLTRFFDSLGNPRNAVEEDARVRADLSAQPGEANRRVALLKQKVGGAVTEPGYTGLEGLLNYVYYQTGALNQFDQIGHLLHFIILEVGTTPCGDYSGGGTAATVRYPNGSTNPITADPCVSILGRNQPGIGAASNKPTPGLPRYDNSVCPTGSTALAICDPTISTHGATTRSSGARVGAAPTQNQPSPITPQVLQDLQNGKPIPKPLQQLLAPNGKPLTGGALNAALQALGLGTAQGQSAAPPAGQPSGAGNLLNFLFGS